MIHQIFWRFKNGETLENIPKYIENVSQTQEFCKLHNYNYKLWDLKDCQELIEEYFDEYLELWNDFRYEIQRVDFIKYCILWKCGGIYLDCDVRPMKNLDNVFNEPIYFCHWADDKKKLPYNAVMGSAQNQKLLLDILDESLKSYYEKSKMEVYDSWKGRFVFQTTGHHMIERVIKKQKINKNKFFHDDLYIHNPDKKGMKKIGNMDTALFYDSNASHWYDNII